MNNNSDFANRLKELRIKSMETQASMAKKCGVSTRMWIKYEQGLSIPGGEVFLTLAAQGMDMEYLLTGITLSEDDALTVYLPPKEQELIKYYRQATDKNQEIILTLAKMVEKKPVWLGVQKLE